MRVVLDVCCKRAVADGFMTATPVPATVYKRCTSKKVEVMSDPNQKILEDFLFQDLSLMNSGITLGLYSGMRLGEVCAARWKHYDFRRGCLHIAETVRRISLDDLDAPYGQRTKLVFSSAKTESSERDLFLPDVLQDLLVAIDIGHRGLIMLISKGQFASQGISIRFLDRLDPVSLIIFVRILIGVLQFITVNILCGG